MPTELLIGICSFFCGFAVMFAIHRVMFDYYDDDAREEIYRLKAEISDLKNKPVSIRVEEVHTYATPADVADLDFLEE